VTPPHAAPAATSTGLGVLYNLANHASDFIVNLAAAVLILIATLVAASWAARLTQRALERFHGRRDADATLRIFAASVVRYTVVILGSIVVLQQLGVQTTSIIAAVGAASLAIGLAMQGALSNVAAGVMILVLRPFRVGDIIEAGGKIGRVRTLDLFVTELATLDNLKIVMPNGKVFGDVIVNHSFHDLRRADALFHAPPAANLPALVERLRRRLEADPRVVKDPPPLVEVTAVTEGFVEIAVRPWASRNDYGALKADILLCARLLEADPGAELPPPPEGGQHGRPAVEAAPIDQGDPLRSLRLNPGRRPPPLATSS
jgi:small conductance mechanosensitive channel